jgi:xylulokinase
MGYLLGIDIGTSGTKTLLIDESGAARASKTVEYPLLTPHPGWAEQRPDDWWRATCDSIRAVLAKSRVKPADIKAIGLSGQMHGSVFLDEKGKVVRPCILWCDGRTAAECDEIMTTVGPARMHDLVSNPALAGFTAPKVVWLRNHEPDRFARVRQILLPKDYIRYRLTGEYAAEVSDAAGTVMFDVKNRRWSDELLDLLKIPREWLPPVFESYDVCGHVTPTAARATGLVKGIPCVGGGADNTCAAIGCGVVVEGRVMTSIGSSGTVVAPTDQPYVDPQERLHTFCHSTRRQWYLMGCMLTAGMSLQWYRNQLAELERAAAKKKKADVYDILMDQAGKTPPGAEGLFFLPYLMGERSPHKDPFARGAFVGLSFRHTKGHLVRAIVEGVTFALRDSLEIMKGLGAKIEQVRLIAGGAKSPFWRQMVADVFGQAVVIPSNTEGAAMGAAILAGVGAGVFGDFVETTERILPIASSVDPDPKQHEQYNEVYSHFVKLYPALKGHYGEMGRVLKL